MRGQLQAGVARATITPPVGIFMIGYAAREHGATAIHDDLTATALVLTDGETSAAVVSCDLLFLHPTTARRVRELVARRTGIPGDNVMLCCSHTHSGPVVYVTEEVDDGRRPYVDLLPYLIAGAVEEASHSLRDARWGVGRGQAEIGINRRQRLSDGRVKIGSNPQGPTDPDVLLLRVEAADGEPLALLVNHACHAVCLSSDSYAISADWPGVMRRQVEAEIGGRVGFIQGACADINPRGGPQPTFDSAQQLGQEIAREVLRVYPEVALQSDVTIRVARRQVGLPLLGPIGRDGKPVPPVSELASRATGLPWETVHQLLEHRFPWAAEVEERDGVWYTAAEVQVLRLGDVALVGVAAEPFVEIGREVKARSSAAFTFFAGYTNGCISYLPTPLAYDLGGYEVEQAYIYYRLPAPLAPACADLVIGASLTMIEEVGLTP